MSNDHNVNKHENLENIEGLFLQLKGNPYDYATYISLIELLRKHEMLSELHATRKNFHSIFPLTEVLWLEWIEDENRSAVTYNQKDEIQRLYDEAIKDYLSIDLWDSYIGFILHKHSLSGALDLDEGNTIASLSEDSIKQIRRVFIRAIEATQYHLSKSHIVWDKYSGFEERLLEAFPSQEQMKHVKDLYLSRLRIPHSTIEQTFSSYSTFITNNDNANYEINMMVANGFYETAKVKWNKREDFELRLTNSQNDIEVFNAYIAWERRQKPLEDQLLCALYERAITCHCLDVNIWENYILYLMENAKPPNVLAAVLERSVRNCPWSGEFWSYYARVQEQRNVSHSEMENIFERAFATGGPQNNVEEFVKLLMARLDYEKRRVHWEVEETLKSEANSLKQVIESSVKTFVKVFPDGDPYFRLERYTAYIYGKLLNDVKESRRIWDNVVKQHGHEAEAWLQYIAFERSLGNLPKCESLFKQAVDCTSLDWPERVYAAWLAFEHECGDFHSQHTAVLRVKRMEKELTTYRAKIASTQMEHEAEIAAAEEEKRQKRKERNKERLREFKRNGKQFGVVSNKRSTDSNTGGFLVKRIKTEGNIDANSQFNEYGEESSIIKIETHRDDSGDQRSNLSVRSLVPRAVAKPRPRLGNIKK